MEGSVHHYVSHGRVDVRNLIKHNKRGLISPHFASRFQSAHPFGFFGKLTRGGTAKQSILLIAQCKCNNFAISPEVDDYLSFRGQFRQKLVHIFKSISLLQPLKDTLDLVRVIQCPRAQSQLCYLGWGKQWQWFLLQHNNKKEHWHMWDKSTVIKSWT